MSHIRFEKSWSVGTVISVIVYIIACGVFVGTTQYAISAHQKQLDEQRDILSKHQVSIEELKETTAELKASNLIMSEWIRHAPPAGAMFKPIPPSIKDQ